jgi:hypothetical protein
MNRANVLVQFIYKIRLHHIVMLVLVECKDQFAFTIRMDGSLRVSLHYDEKFKCIRVKAFELASANHQVYCAKQQGLRCSKFCTHTIIHVTAKSAVDLNCPVNSQNSKYETA